MVGEARVRNGWRSLALVAVVAFGCRAETAPVTGTSPAGLYYEVSGSGEPVVLIHGFSLDHRMWAPQLDALRARYRVIRYDLRGHGRSAGFAGPYAGRDDLADVLDALGVDSAALVGLSAGAQIAVDFALERPARVTGLVLAAPGLGGYVARDPYDWLVPIMEAVRAGDAEEAARRWAASVLMAVPQNAAGDSLMRVMAMDNAGLWLIASNPEQGLDPPAIGRLTEIDVPMLIVVGERDLRDIHRIADTLAVCVAGAAKRVLPGAGHLVNLASPEAFTEEILQFLAGSARAEPALPRRTC